MYDIILAYAEGDALIAAIYLMAITLIPMAAFAWHRGSLRLHDQYGWFWIAFAWALLVCAEVSGIIQLDKSSMTQIIQG